jgi:formiminoglutamase
VSNKHFHYYFKQDILSLTRLRRYETKLGERIQCIAQTELSVEEMIRRSTAQIVLFGIPEDIGVKANDGLGGTDSAWLSFLSSFLNIQSNDFIGGEELMLLGHFDFGDIQFLIEQHAGSAEEKRDAWRHATVTIDDAVEQIVKMIVRAGKIPVAIGGGHNNAYPMIKGTAKGLYDRGLIPLAQINAINLDAHADYRPAEGRHSGNAFRYAEDDGFLQKYCVVGLHENYLPQNVWMDLVNNPFMDCITYEDIYIHEKRHFLQAVAHATAFTEDTFTGIEIDMDAIEGVLSSAQSPSGIPVADARRFVNFTALDCKVAYLHICEAATQLSDGRKDASVGKLLSYLVSDFVKAVCQKAKPRLI